MPRPTYRTIAIPTLLLCGVMTLIVRTEPSPPASPPGAGEQGTFGKRRAIVFGIDGLRSDALKLAVENGTAPHIASLIRSGAVTWNAYAGGDLGTPTQQTTNSGPGWASVLTGVWVDRHGVNSNAFTGRNFNDYPHFFKRIKDSYPASELSSLVSWPEIHQYIVNDSGGTSICTCPTFVNGSYNQRDSELIAETIRTVTETHPDVVFCYQGNVDITGHNSGFHPDVPAYMEAIAVADQRIGQVLEAVRQRPQFAQEDWLMIVTTDHGGKGYGHGGQSEEERRIPFVASGGNVPQGVISKEVIGHVAVPATVYRHLGLGIPASWGWASDAFQIGSKLIASPGARSVFLQWKLPPSGLSNLSGFDLYRNGELLATLPAETRSYTDSNPGAPGTNLSYSVHFKGTVEAPASAATQAPGLPPTPPDPVLYLNFDQQLLDQSGRGNHAAAEGTASFTAGHKGHALQLNGSSSARIGTTAAGAPQDLRFGGDTDFTVAFWFRSDAAWSADPSIISNKNWASGANTGWILAGESGGSNWQWNLKGNLLSRKDFDPSNAGLGDREWHWIAVTHDRDGVASFYHDGQPIGAVSIAGAGTVDTAFPVRIGRDGNNAYPWNQGAAIDELKIWRHALTPAQIRSEFQQQNATAAYQFWIEALAALQIGAPSALLPEQDADQDGASNLMEFCAGTHPFLAADRPLVTLRTAAGLSRLSFLQRNGGHGLHSSDSSYISNGYRFVVETTSSPLLPWQALPASSVQQDDPPAIPFNDESHPVTVEIPANASPAAFYRLRVEPVSP